MRRLGLGVGLAVNPETPIEACLPWLDRIDLLLVMTVHPGFGGQHFMPEVVPKVVRAAEIVRDEGLGLSIEVDGGIDVHTAAVMAEAGADTFVAGSAIFGHADPEAAARAIRSSVAGGAGAVPATKVGQP